MDKQEPSKGERKAPNDAGYLQNRLHSPDVIHTHQPTRTTKILLKEVLGLYQVVPAGSGESPEKPSDTV